MGLVSLAGCVHIAPPASAPPSADAALARMRATLACGRAIEASAKIDHFGDEGRVRGDVMLFAAQPARVRMDIVSPFGVALATLTSDGERFALADLRDRRFFVGPASACNIARLTTVAVPAHVLVDLLRGEAPVLKHDPRSTTMTWDTHGYWILRIPGTNESVEEVHLAPRPNDWSLPWERQRMRVLDVSVRQQGIDLYHASLDSFAPTATAGPRLDPDNLAPPEPPSGPPCDAETPGRIHMEVPNPRSDVRFSYEQRTWNPPLPPGTFTQQAPPGMPEETVTCGP